MDKTTTLLCILITAVFSVGALAQDAKEIVRKADQKFRGETRKSEVEMQIVRPSWSRTMKMKTWLKGDRYAMILITAPAREEGTAYLKRGNEVWNWIPKVERKVKLPPSMMMQSWMGSDFTNNDLVRESSIVEDYHHTLLGTESYREENCYKIKMEPKPDASVVWDKVIMWITSDDYIQLKTEFYGEDGELVNILTLSDIQTMDGRRVPAKMVMEPADKKGHKTILQYHSIKFNETIPDDFFSIQNMKNLR